MPRMMTTARLAFLLLGLSPLLCRSVMASPLITHRLSTVRANATTVGSGSDFSSAAAPSSTTTRPDAPPPGVTPAEISAPSVSSPVISPPASQSSVLSGPERRASSSGLDTELPESGPPGSTEARAAANAALPAQSVGGGPASIPARGVTPPAGMVTPRVVDGLTRVESGRGSAVQASAPAGVSTPAQQPAQPSSDAASTPGLTTSSTGKSSSPPTATAPASSQPVPAAPSPTSSAPAAQMLAGPGPGTVQGSGPVSTPATVPETAAAGTPPAAGTTNPPAGGMTNPSTTSRPDPSGAGGTASQAGTLVDGSTPVGSVTSNPAGSSLAAGHMAASWHWSRLTAPPPNPFINSGAAGGTSSDLVSTLSAINALSIAPNPLSSASVPTSASTLPPLPTVRLTDPLPGPSPPAAYSDRIPWLARCQRAFQSHSVLDMLVLLALGSRVKCAFRSAARLRPRSQRPAIGVPGAAVSLMQGHGDLGGQAGIGHQQGAIGPEALPSCGLRESPRGGTA